MRAAFGIEAFKLKTTEDVQQQRKHSMTYARNVGEHTVKRLRIADRLQGIRRVEPDSSLTTPPTPTVHKTAAISRTSTTQNTETFTESSMKAASSSTLAQERHKDDPELACLTENSKSSKLDINEMKEALKVECQKKLFEETMRTSRDVEPDWDASSERRKRCVAYFTEALQMLDGMES
ncbi:hypothetical protein BJ508DRAFT_308253 [Ascobolus immersus RN42]|uniref:Uncharacterized protein n=1 Tax=Ascobolus immersus RN42 TaxID=1160509 RepID=A0A3N4I059_ASCIM|nr:hypothetical protein BJ508DRAFT_308253 [Ascobolus immersus RN42]